MLAIQEKQTSVSERIQRSQARSYIIYITNFFPSLYFVLGPYPGFSRLFITVATIPRCMGDVLSADISLRSGRAFFKDFPVGGHFLKRDLSVR